MVRGTRAANIIFAGAFLAAECSPLFYSRNWLLALLVAGAFLACFLVYANHPSQGTLLWLELSASVLALALGLIVALFLGIGLYLVPSKANLVNPYYWLYWLAWLSPLAVAGVALNFVMSDRRGDGSDFRPATYAALFWAIALASDVFWISRLRF